MLVQPGESFSETLTMSPEEAKAFSRAARDFNPLHLDEEFAARSRYGRLIVSGTQMAAHMMALAASHFSARADVVGLDFSVRFHRAIYSDETITLSWTVTAVTPTSSGSAEVVEIKGRIENAKGDMAVACTGRLMASRKP